ncbi:tetratricopeptide repeat-containing sensor histidine kinase [Shivajiella indica]|uniref:histidine kinase n=1 Tax=Shivajiella indica TaxID=872115 RepID=A0ABW5B9D3_9BACT
MMKRVLFFLIFLNLHVGIYAQDYYELDSLKAIVPSLEKSEKLNALNRITFLLRELDITQAFEYGNEAEKLALALNDSLALGRAKSNLGWIYYRAGVWEKAFRNSRDAYLIGLKKNDRKELAMSLNNLGSIYYQQRNFDDAIKKFKEAYTIGIELEDTYLIVRSVNNIALNYSRSNQLDSALLYAHKALGYNEIAGTNFFKSFTYRVIGDVQMEKNQIDEAISTYEYALSVSSHQRSNNFETSINHRLGKAYWLKGESKKAIAVLEEAKEVAIANNFQDDLAQTLKVLALVYESMNNIALAYQNQKAYNNLVEIIGERVDKDRLALISGMFEVEKTDAEVKMLKAENELQQVQVNNFKMLSIMVTFGALVLGFLLVWLFSLHKKSISTNAHLFVQQEKVNQQKIALEKQSRELNLSNKLKDRIFSILGHDLKSPVAQLQGVLGLLQNKDLSKEEFYEISHVLKRNVDGLYIALENILSWSRSQMEGFKVHLSPVSYKSTINQCLEFLDQQAKAKDISFNLKIENDLKVWVDQDLITIVIRNVISNAIKYSRKNSKIDVFTQSDSNSVSLMIRDYGVGMNQKKLEEVRSAKFSLLESSIGTENERGTGLGLNLCKEFTQMMGGDIEFESEKERGTTVSLKFKRVQVIAGSLNALQQAVSV